MTRQLLLVLVAVVVCGGFMMHEVSISAQDTFAGSSKSVRRTNKTPELNSTASSSAEPAAITAPAHPQHIVDFDGDGTTDFTVIRDNGGSPAGWYTFLNDGTFSKTRFQEWGVASVDYPEPADYDGDHHTDLAIWRGPSGQDAAAFWILNSFDGTVSIIPWGVEGDDPSVIGDYDGDGKADAAIARYDYTANTTTFWYLPTGGTSKGEKLAYQWGLATDYVYPGDFNGDGKQDFAVTRDSGNGTSEVWIHYSTGNSSNDASVSRLDHWGVFSDNYVPGDFDGDGVTDMAIARKTGGIYEWWVRWSTDNSVHVTKWGADTDLITQGDYDGDGKTDVAVWRRSDATFYVIASATGSPVIFRWGVPGPTSPDTPAAGYNVE